MSSQQITDFLTKQLFIERNIVTYRSLSRQFSIHVNTAKNELATFHHGTQFQSDKSSAQFFLSGVLRTQRKGSSSYDEDEDVDMESELSSTQDDGYEDMDSEDVPQTSITIVNERDLEDAKIPYATVQSIHIYSLSPVPVHDADLLCAPKTNVLNADKVGGRNVADAVGRLVGADIKIKELKKAIPSAGPVAGPSKLKQPETKPTITKGPSIGAIPAPKVGTTDKGKEKQKPTGKIDFFKSAPKQDKTVVKKEVKEEPEPANKPMFFSKKAAPLPPPKVLSPAPSATSVGDDAEKPTRGVKRKSSAGIQPAKAKSLEKSSVIVKKRIIVSDDEEEEVIPKVSRRQARRKSAAVLEDDEDEDRKAAMALMDVDDDVVEKASRGASSRPSVPLTETEDEMKDDAQSVPDGDVEMFDVVEAAPKAKPKARREKKVVPVGKNGLKKRRVEKVRKVVDDNGYILRETYSDWESVEEEEEPAEKVPAKAKAKATKPKANTSKADENTKVSPPAAEAEAPAEKPQLVRKPAAASAAKAKPKAASSAKGKQPGLMHFFGGKK